jgi:hypothetical protein
MRLHHAHERTDVRTLGKEGRLRLALTCTIVREHLQRLFILESSVREACSPAGVALTAPALLASARSALTVTAAAASLLMCTASAAALSAVGFTVNEACGIMTSDGRREWSHGIEPLGVGARRWQWERRQRHQLRYQVNDALETAVNRSVASASVERSVSDGDARTVASRMASEAAADSAVRTRARGAAEPSLASHS